MRSRPRGEPRRRPDLAAIRARPGLRTSCSNAVKDHAAPGVSEAELAVSQLRQCIAKPAARAAI